MIGAAVFLSIMLVLGFTAYRYGIRLYYQLVAANLAATAGQSTYRDCRHLNEELIPACLLRVKQGAMTAGLSVGRFPAQVVVSLYRKEGGVRLVSTTGPSGRFSSRFSLNSFTGNSGSHYFKEMMDAHEDVCVAEIFIDFRPFHGLSFGSGTVYESSLS